MEKLKNIKQWKTSLVGVICYVIAFYYLLKVDSPSIVGVIALIVFATLMLFSADSLVGSLSRFLKNNEGKKL